jgi:hypothetical protein
LGLKKKVEMFVEFQNYIDHAPLHPRQMLGNAASNDGATIESWRDTWLNNIRANKERWGSFAEHGIGSLSGIYKHTPCIIAGSGPSLKNNIAKLKNRDGISMVSCLHNFHYMEDNDANPDFYVTLDAGKVTIDEVSEGGSQSPEWYWDRTEDRRLLAFIGTDPELLARWQGKIYFFNCPVPDKLFQEQLQQIESFNTFLGNGGNVLGACLYFAKGIAGANPIIFTGADFSFGYDDKFHSWDSKYDANMGHIVKMTDVYGNKVSTWPSYFNFKNWFDYVCSTVPGIWINATEGGCLGSYPEGNIRAIKQMDFDDVITMYTMHKHLEEQCAEPGKYSNLMLF